MRPAESFVLLSVAIFCVSEVLRIKSEGGANFLIADNLRGKSFLLGFILVPTDKKSKFFGKIRKIAIVTGQTKLIREKKQQLGKEGYTDKTHCNALPEAAGKGKSTTHRTADS